MPNTKPLYKLIAELVVARQNCIKSGNDEWRQRHFDRLNHLEKCYMPSGSGFDNGTSLQLEESNSTKLVFITEFHHMNEHGYYDGWTRHKVTVKPDFVHDFTLTISGPNRNGIKDYIHDTFVHVLTLGIVDDTAEPHLNLKGE